LWSPWKQISIKKGKQVSELPELSEETANWGENYENQQ